MAKRDFYEILGVSRNADEESLKKAFRNKALEYHPDRNKDPGAEAKFKEINEAYHVLSDPEMRSRYDQYGHDGIGNGNGGFARDFDGADIFGGFGDIFDSFFGGFSGTRTRGGPRQGDDIQVSVNLAFEEAAFGTEKEIQINRVELCSRCNSSCSEPGHSPERCSTCKGTGQIRRAQRSIFGQFVQQGICSTCKGKGEIVTTPCKNCNGVGYEKRKRAVAVKIPPGVDNGMQVRLSNEGNVGIENGPPGHLYVSVSVKEHKFFHRVDNDLIYELPINMFQAILGGAMEVPTLGGTKTIKVPAGSQHDTTFRLKGEGIVDINGSRRRDLIVKLKVIVPTKLNDKQIALMKDIASTMGDVDLSPKEKGWFDKVKDAFVNDD
jgi:molecular chaperone DnaJ